MSISPTIINDVLPRTQIVATSGQVQFDCTWTADVASDIVVFKTPNGDAPDDATQVVSTNDYTVTFVGGSRTVRVTFGTGVDEDDLITIIRNTLADRQNLYTNTNFTPTMLNQDFGIRTLVEQQAQLVNDEIAPKYNYTATIEDSDLVLPILEAQQVWRKNEDNTGFEAYTIDGTPAPSSSPFITYEADASLENPQNLGLLSSGILKQTVASGTATLSIATPGTDYYGPGQTPPIPVAEGGTGSATAAGARTNLGLGTMAVQDANAVAITGGSAVLGSGSVATSPSAGIDIANKDYVDTVAAGFTFVSPTNVATTADLNATYDNGVSGVGATLTCNVNGAITVDGVALNTLDRVLVKDQSTTYENGIYYVSTQGDGSNPFVLTRSTDYDAVPEISAGNIIFVLGGASYTNASFVETAVVVVIGTSPILFQQFSQTFPLSMGNGGTGASLTPTVNNLVYSTASEMALLATANNGVLVTSAGGVPSIATTLPSGLTIPGYATSGANSNITSMTGLTGGLRAPTAILDTNGNEVISFTGVASAVNEINFLNGATGVFPEMRPQGGDTNIDMTIRTKGTGQMNFTSENTTAPFRWYSGTSLQHTTVWSVPNTAAGRTITLQDLDGTMAYLADRGAVLLNTFTSSAVAQQDITGLTGYTNYLIVFNNLLPATNATSLLMRFSDNNGSSYIATANYNTQGLLASNASVSAAQTVGATTITTSNSWINTATIVGGGSILLCNFNSANSRKNGLFNAVYVSSAGLMANYQCGFQFVGTNTLNALAMYFSSGNITSGTWSVYGLK